MPRAFCKIYLMSNHAIGSIGYGQNPRRHLLRIMHQVLASIIAHP